MSGPALLSILAAADYLSCSRRTLQTLLALRKLRAVRITPRLIRIERAELDRYIASLRIEGGAR